MDIATLIFIIIVSIVWGYATQAVITNKGYDERWFLWGFFFGIIAFLVALSKPPYIPPTSNKPSNLSAIADEEDRKRKRQQNYWECSCGRMNAPYVTTCVCGLSAKEVKRQNDSAIQKIQENEKKTAELENLNLLSKYKEMLDSGVITEEEFNIKKRELLKL
ncbi:MAG: SHOCT domain-containing protein [Oscillospiraceae bacterium]|nr:SHOCT domain-containing protein [Oscillospiraceae bacterium]